MFSKACEYGIKACVFIAQESVLENRVNLKQISNSINSPEAYTAKILQQLVKANVISSIKGKMGGFKMNGDHLEDIKLVHIIKAIDGDGIYHSCILGLVECDANKPCALHSRVFAIRNDLRGMLESTSMFNLIDDLEKGIAFLKH